MTKPLFEHQTCTRCGGTGQFSFNQKHGSMCYGCNGSGIQLTKRGQAAQRFFTDSCMVRLDSLQIGDLMQIDDVIGGKRYFAPVVETRATEHGRYVVTTEHAKYGRSGLDAFPGTMVRKGQTAEEKQAKRDAALAYQESLTKTGKPRKAA
jgi:hypothetical protein